MVEYPAVNRVVGGSSPLSPAKYYETRTDRSMAADGRSDKGKVSEVL